MRRHIVKRRAVPRPRPEARPRPRPEAEGPPPPAKRPVLHWRPEQGGVSKDVDGKGESYGKIEVMAATILNFDDDGEEEESSIGSPKQTTFVARRKDRLARREAHCAGGAALPEPTPEEVCAPAGLSSLILPKKAKDQMLDLLRDCDMPIVLSGPSGVGKTSLVKLACRQLGITLLDPGGWEDFASTRQTVDNWVAAASPSCCLLVETLEMFEPSRRQVLRRRMAEWCKRVRVVVTVDSAYDMKLSKLKSVRLVTLYEPGTHDIARYARHCCDVLGVSDVSRSVAAYCQSFRAAANVIAFSGGRRDAIRSVEADYRSRTIFQAVEEAVSGDGFSDPPSASEFHSRGVHNWATSSAPNLVRYGDVDSLSLLTDCASMSDLMGPLSSAGKSGRVVPNFPRVQFALQAESVRIVAKPRRDRMRGKVVSPSMLWAGMPSSGGGAGRRLRLDEVFLALKISLDQKKPEALRDFLFNSGMDERKYFLEASDSFLKMAKWLLKLSGAKPSVAAKIQRWLAKLSPPDMGGVVTK